MRVTEDVKAIAKRRMIMILVFVFFSWGMFDW